MNEDNDLTQSSKSPEDKLSSGQKKRIIDLRRRAEAAFYKHNFIWAAELYASIFQMDRRANSDYLIKMLEAAVKNKQKAANQFVFSIKALMANLSFYFKVLKTKPVSEENLLILLDALETIIISNIGDSFAVLKLVKLYEDNDFFFNAASVLEFSLEFQKNKVSILEKMGELYLLANNPEKAKDAFKNILKIKPHDQKSEKALRDILATTSISQNKMKETAYQDVIKDKKFARRQEIEEKLEKTNEELDFLIAEKLNDISKSPKNLTLYYNLLQLYKDKNDIENIFQTLTKISNLVSGDISVLIEKAEAEIVLVQHKLVQKNDLDQEQRKVFVLEEKARIFKEINDRFPTNASILYKRAEVLFELHRFDEALQLFQQCAKHREFAASSMNYMGLILKEKKMLDMAIDQFKSGIGCLEKMTSVKKKLIYNLALTFEDNDDLQQALESYKILYKEDVAYKDVAQRIEAAYKK